MRTRFGLAAGLALIAVTIVAGAALAQDVKTNYLPGTDFKKFKTYKWVTIEGAAQPDQIVDAQIKQAIDGVLAGKGFTRVTGDNADLYIGYQAAVREEREWTAYGTGGLRWAGGMQTATSTTIKVGAVQLDMYDPVAKSLVWKGLATNTIDPGNDPEKIQKRLNKGAAKLLKNFPPRPK